MLVRTFANAIIGSCWVSDLINYCSKLWINLKIQLVAICDRLALLKHSSVFPMVFTEQGVAMLSSVLRSEKAIRINIDIMRAFSHYRSFLYENNELRKEITDLDNKLNDAFRFLLKRLDELHQTRKERKPIGYKSYQDNLKESE